MLLIQFLVFQVLSFLALAVFLQRFVGRHATTTTAHLQGLTQEYLRREEELKRRLEEAERQYQDLLAKAEREGQHLKERAVHEGEEKRQKRIEEGRQEAERIVHQALQAKESLRKELQSSLAQEAVRKACELIREILPQELKETDHARWVDGVIHNGLLPMDTLDLKEPVEEAQVISAQPLTDHQRGFLLGKIQEAVGHPLVLKEAVDPQLIAGLMVRVGHWVLDGTLSSKLTEAVRHAENAA